MVASEYICSVVATITYVVWLHKCGCKANTVVCYTYVVVARRIHKCR